jgi:hypothetical protein
MDGGLFFQQAQNIKKNIKKKKKKKKKKKNRALASSRFAA